MGRGRRGREDLEVEVPSFFRCPISLDVMKSPVSLCTGVTYDRSSIQTWIETGHNTCPATMQILPSTDLVPNHTVRRLIQRWSSSSSPSASSPTVLLRQLQCSSGDALLIVIRAVLDIAGDPHRVREIAEDPTAIPELSAVLRRQDLDMDAMEAVVLVLLPVLLARGGGNVAQMHVDSRTLSSLISVLKDGSLQSRIAAANIIEMVAASGGAAGVMAEAGDLMPALLRLVGEEEEEGDRAAKAGLSCLAALSSERQMRVQIVRAGAVAAAGKVLGRSTASGSAAESAMKLMEVAASCSEGRVAICEDPTAVQAMVARMMKLSAAARETAVLVMWLVCCLFHDRRAQEAAARGGGLTKILLMLQSNCSPAARQMAADLIKFFRVNGDGCLTNYDSRKIHITPF